MKILYFILLIGFSIEAIGYFLGVHTPSSVKSGFYCVLLVSNYFEKLIKKDL